MAIIQKRAEDLKPGDIFVWSFPPMPMHDGPVPQADERRVVTQVFDHGSPSGMLQMTSVQLGVPWSAVSVQTDAAPMFRMFNVEVPEPIISREDLDVLLDLADTALDPSKSPPAIQRVYEIVNRVRPPEPPTLAEALAALETVLLHMWSTHSEDGVERGPAEILERARRAGLLPKGDA